MSYRDDQPYEVPERTVDHELPADEWREGSDYIAGIGTAKTEHIWAGKDANADWEREIREREQRRATLGGFGFRNVS